MDLFKIETFLFKKFYADIDNIRIIIDAFIFFYLRKGLIYPQLRSVRSVGRHCFDHISDTDNAGFKDNFFAAETCWITGTVKPLVVLQNGLINRPGEFYPLQYFISYPRVVLDDVEFRFI